jgi:hypothetical protein
MGGGGSERRSWVLVAGLAVAGLAALGAITLVAWTLDETHFDRPDAGFDRYTTQLEELPGVTVDAKERWVEAPLFLPATSRVSLTVDQANLPALLDATCTAEYADPVTWSLRVQTDAGDTVSLHDQPAAPGPPSGSPCFDAGLDAVALVDEVDRLHPGVDLQATLREDGSFALLDLDFDGSRLSSLLPLVAHADELRAAAGLDSGLTLEIGSTSLIALIEAGEHDRYLALLTTLAEEHGVTSFSADGGGTPMDGIEKVQLTAPAEEHAAAEAAIRSSGLHIAAFPVRFLPEQ